LNTPQFDWVKNRLPREAQPVPPIYQPEIAADAIVWAAAPRRRELSVGATTAAVIWTNKIGSGLLDRYLAKYGYESQQTDRPKDPQQADNLWAPLPGDRGAHGRFGARAITSSPQTWANQHVVPLLGLAASSAALLWIVRSRRAPSRT
jgi:hypothetical protein